MKFKIRKNINEDTVKQNGKWVNKGEEGTHGEFATKKEADAQRKAMFAQGYKEELEDSGEDQEYRGMLIVPISENGEQYYRVYENNKEEWPIK